MADHNGSQEPQPVRAGQFAVIPAMPSVSEDELYRGRPELLLESDLHYSVGWQDRRAGPSFVVARIGRLGAPKITQRFPLTEQGWASAWQALSAVDTDAAAAISANLAKKEAGRRAVAALAELDTESVRSLRRLNYRGGSGGLPLVNGQSYDVRFLRDRIMVCPPGSVAAILEVPFQNVETLEVGGPGQVGMSTGEVLALILGLGLLGALVGLVLFGVRGLLLGAMLLGFAGALVGAGSTKTETILRMRDRSGEFYFAHTDKRPEALRIELSEPLMAISNARAAQAGEAGESAESVSSSIPDQLSKLATLLQRGLITRDEFEHLKTQLIAKS